MSVKEKNKQETMPDSIRERIIRLIYEKGKLNEIHDDCTEDEFVTRVFKGREESMGIESRRFWYIFFGLWWEVLEPLTDFCKQNNLEMNIHGSKEHEEVYLEIYVKDDQK